MMYTKEPPNIKETLLNMIDEQGITWESLADTLESRVPNFKASEIIVDLPATEILLFNVEFRDILTEILGTHPDFWLYLEKTKIRFIRERIIRETGHTVKLRNKKRCSGVYAIEELYISPAFYPGTL